MHHLLGVLLIIAVPMGVMYLWETMQEKVTEGSTTAKVLGGLEAAAETVGSIFDTIGEWLALIKAAGMVALGIFLLYIGGMRNIWIALLCFLLAGLFVHIG